MKYAFISDIHGNLEALNQALRLIDVLACDKIICLGDIVGYGPFPNECIEKTRQSVDQIVIGNHDSAAIMKTATTYFNEYAKEAIDWTRKELSAECEAYLESLDLEYLENQFRALHATPNDPEKWNYILTFPDAYKNFGCFSEKICFIGHSHVPAVFKYGSNPSRVLVENGPDVQLSDDYRYIINVGSVGQPRDGDPRASIGVYDDKYESFQLFRVEYDVAATQSAMHKKGLPDFLIQRLEFGK
ncbi:metallophosphoesterase family protein [candidate division KSB1 bacterium]|nr:metallophosphoesterase family protein [candidate division KSB1 bacterium]